MSNELLHKALIDPASTRELLGNITGHFVSSGSLSPEQGLRIYLNNRITTLKEWLEEDFPTYSNLDQEDLIKLNVAPFKSHFMNFLASGVLKSNLRKDVGAEFLYYFLNLDLDLLTRELLLVDYLIGICFNAQDGEHFRYLTSGFVERFKGFESHTFVLKPSGINVSLNHDFSIVFTNESTDVSSPSTLSIDETNNKVSVRFLGVR